MSLYGLDVLIERDTGKYHINEINGIASGMHGFRQIYGDDRVEKKVYAMLEEKYGPLSVYDGTR
jgi:glutathione synthase/RimK-type ligase-like ATP-grasp enzyme